MNWEKWITAMMTQQFAVHLVLESGEYLSDVVSLIMEDPDEPTG